MCKHCCLQAVRRAGLRLLHAEVHVARCPHRQDFDDGKYAGDNAAFGRDIAASCSSFMHAKVVRAFAAKDNGRPSEERVALVEEMFARLAARIAARPHAFGIDNVMAMLVIEKETHSKQ